MQELLAQHAESPYEKLQLLTLWPPYYRDAKRPYRFVVKTSVDGVNWTLHIDKRGNSQPFGAAGLTEKFQNTPMRYIRVENAGGNTVNRHLNIVEVLAK